MAVDLDVNDLNDEEEVDVKLDDVQVHVVRHDLPDHYFHACVEMCIGIIIFGCMGPTW